jgi:hypothetical protein
VHVDLGQQVHHVGGLVQRDPVELQVLARGEVAEAAALGGRPASRWSCSRAMRARACAAGGRQLAVGHGHAQHRCMALHVPAVLQAQRAEVVVGQLAGQVALELVAELGRAGADEPAIEVGVLVHGAAAEGREWTLGSRFICELHIRELDIPMSI